MRATFTQATATFTKCTEEGTNCELVVTLRLGNDACDWWMKKEVLWTPAVNSIWKVDSSEPKHPQCPLDEVRTVLMVP